MQFDYFIAALVALLIIIVYQLIKLNIFVLKIGKHSELFGKEIKEDKDWEFIKGLY